MRRPGRTVVLALLAILTLAACGGNQDNTVAQALGRLLDVHHVQHGQITCAHINGNVYSCGVNTPTGQRMANVVDDGHTIAEQGIPAP